jgi:hypothetical protein
MLVRIRIGKGPNLFLRQRRKQKLAHALAALLTPAALMAFALGIWRIAAGFNWAGGFAIASGVFSYWETWIGLGIALQLGSRVLNRYGKESSEAAV